MSCRGGNRVSLASNIELQSFPTGGAKTWWGPVVSFRDKAILLRLLILFTRVGSVRFRARFTLDGVTWLPANSTDAGAMVGYIDAGLAITSTPALWSHQYLGIAEEHVEMFQIGIEVSGTGGQGSVTLSAEAEFGDVLPRTSGNIGTLGVLPPATPTPIPVPGAIAVKTAGARAVRIQARFAAVVGAGTLPVLYLATGTSVTPSQMISDNAPSGRAIAATEIDASFIIEGPSDWSCVYFTTALVTPAINSITMTVLP